MSRPKAIGRVMIVGEANPNPRFHHCALWPWPARSAGGRLAAHLGLRPIEFYHAFTLRNLYDDGPPDRWVVGEMQYRASMLVCQNPESHVVLLGNRVSRAFECHKLPLFRWTRVRLFGRIVRHVIRLPHPSGLCRTWNDPAVVRRARRALAGHVPSR